MLIRGDERKNANIFLIPDQKLIFEVEGMSLIPSNLSLSSSFFRISFKKLMNCILNVKGPV